MDWAGVTSSMALFALAIAILMPIIPIEVGWAGDRWIVGRFQILLKTGDLDIPVK